MTPPTLSSFSPLDGMPPVSNYPQLATRNNFPLLAFDDGNTESVDFVGVLPASYGGGDFSIVIHWLADSATSGDVVWTAEFERHTIDDATLDDFDVDTDTFGSAVAATGFAPDNTGKLVRTAIAMPVASAADAVAGESFRLRIARDAGNIADTMTGNSLLLAVSLLEV